MKTRRRLVLAAALLGAGLVFASGASDAAKPRRFEDLTNPFLGPDYTSWLIGAPSRLATDAEVAEFLALKSDEAAAAWVDSFWERRDLTPGREGNPAREVFEARSEEADRLYGEGGFLGRRTARGATYVLYGEPAKVEFDIAPSSNSPAIEVWTYEAKTAKFGLDGRKPASTFRFIKLGDLTVPYVPGRVDRRLRPRPSDDPYR
ncbi:MAG TPA: GWxTD domain-containing protein [Thermoanaerobaculia bacterium]|nr:GWxTD domain-containing protein [Thermoanaerobaculia bacterium]